MQQIQDTSANEGPRQNADAVDAVFDLIVIGAGSNGAGIARDAAARGLRVALVEKEDIGSGTSSWSGRLIHGGLRYLEQGDIRLVRESLRERELMFRLAPHLVKPVPLMMPLYKHNSRPKWMIRVAMWAYDILSFDKSTVMHKVLSLPATIKRFPGMSTEGLAGAAIFMDGQAVWTERLCTEIVLAAHADGAQIYTWSKVDGFVQENGRITGIRYTDQIDGTRHTLKAPVVVNAAGPWVDFVLNDGKIEGKRQIGGARGSHLIVDPFPGAPKDVVYYESRADGRLVLVIPWGERYMIGTTDKKFEDNPDDAIADNLEMDYLLGEVNALIPGANLTPADVLYTYSGVRPLPYVPAQSEWKVPRSHVIFDHGPKYPGLVSVIGGKLTTYRSLAEEMVDQVYKMLRKKAPRCTTRHVLFPGARMASAEKLAQALKASFPVDAATVDRLIDIYGSRAADILEFAARDPDLFAILDPDSGAIKAELVFAFEREFCRTLTDVLIRRIMVGLNGTCGRDVLDSAATILAQRCGWSDNRRKSEIAGYLNYIKRFDVPGRTQASAHPKTAASSGNPLETPR